MASLRPLRRRRGLLNGCASTLDRPVLGSRIPTRANIRRIGGAGRRFGGTAGLLASIGALTCSNESEKAKKKNKTDGRGAVGSCTDVLVYRLKKMVLYGGGVGP